LEELKSKVDRLKTEIAQNEGSLQTVLEQIKKEFSVETIDEAYKKLEAMKADIEVKTEQRDELIETARKMLEKYR
jgi:chorismate-pyruvate lyase